MKLYGAERKNLSKASLGGKYIRHKGSDVTHLTGEEGVNMFGLREVVVETFKESHCYFESQTHCMLTTGKEESKETASWGGVETPKDGDIHNRVITEQVQ